MTANELVEYIAEDLNAPSDEAKRRISHELNVRYKQVTSSIGLIPSRRVTQDEDFTGITRYLTFTDIEKIDAVYRDPAGTYNAPATRMFLKEITPDEMSKTESRGPVAPMKYSVDNVTGSSVTVKLDAHGGGVYTLFATGLQLATTITNNDQPSFPESFHDILIHGVKSDEYRRREKMQLAKECEGMFQQRLSDLRMFLAKSAYLDIFRGKHTPSMGWWDYESGNN